MRSTNYLRALVGAVIVAGASSLAIAVAGPVEDRQADMKAIGNGMKDGAAVMQAFDAAKAKAAMTIVADSAKKAAASFPKGSDTDPKSGADPKVWTDNADFMKRMTELQTLATKAGAAADADAYKAAFGDLNKSCKSCHDVYRKKKPS